METYRIRISSGRRELEVEGSEEFVRSFADQFEQLFDQQQASPSAERPDKGLGDELDFTDSFGALFQRLQSAAGTDRLLLAGRFVQRQSNDHLFSTGEANELLKEQGVKLGNPSQTLANLIKAKFVFRERGKCRVSRRGDEHLKQLMAA
jgi:hypothetical protein